MPAARFTPAVRCLLDAAAAIPLLLDEVKRLPGRALLGLATGNTFAAWLPALGELLRTNERDDVLVTHLDEYLGFAPNRRGGMVHELTTACPPLADRLATGRFLPVPPDGNAASLATHEAALRAAGGVHLQLLGIGRNGHLAFNEPGTAFELGFHVTELAASTRADAAPRFAPAPAPTHAVTSGVATILAAKRLVLCAFGAGKAAAVRAMLHGPIDAACPASALRLHPDVLVLLDAAAASELDAAGRNVARSDVAPRQTS